MVGQEKGRELQGNKSQSMDKTQQQPTLLITSLLQFPHCFCKRKFSSSSNISHDAASSKHAARICTIYGVSTGPGS